MANVNVGTIRLMKTLCRCPLVIQSLPNTCNYQIINSFSMIVLLGDSQKVTYTTSLLPFAMCLGFLPNSVLSSQPPITGWSGFLRDFVLLAFRLGLQLGCECRGGAVMGMFSSHHLI